MQLIGVEFGPYGLYTLKQLVVVLNLEQHLVQDMTLNVSELLKHLDHLDSVILL